MPVQRSCGQEVFLTMVLTGCGTGGGDWACHQLEHELGGLYDVAHGAGLAAIWGSWARYVYACQPRAFRSVCHQRLRHSLLR